MANEAFMATDDSRLSCSLFWCVVEEVISRYSAQFLLSCFHGSPFKPLGPAAQRSCDQGATNGRKVFLMG